VRHTHHDNMSSGKKHTRHNEFTHNETWYWCCKNGSYVKVWPRVSYRAVFVFVQAIRRPTYRVRHTDHDNMSFGKKHTRHDKFTHTKRNIDVTMNASLCIVMAACFLLCCFICAHVILPCYPDTWPCLLCLQPLFFEIIFNK